jgi:hypothetical protein
MNKNKFISFDALTSGVSNGSHITLKLSSITGYRIGKFGSGDFQFSIFINGVLFVESAALTPGTRECANWEKIFSKLDELLKVENYDF